MPYRILLLLFCLLTQFPSVILATDPVKIKKVVIDAGHGGHDPGSISPDRKVKEKTIALSVALKFGKLIEQNNPDIKVIYTRDTDIFIPLDTRSDIANNNKADLFISIHVNSVKARSASGSETYVMGESKSSSNLEVTMKENSVISLEGDHQSVYEGFDPNNPESYIIFSLLQNAHLEQSLQIAEFVQEELGKGPVKINRGIKQGGLIVLWRSSMPAILVELGFISNPNDYLVLTREENHDRFANSLYKAFSKYKKAYESNNGEKVAVKNRDSVVKSERDTLAEIRRALQKKSNIQNEATPEKSDTTKSTLEAKKKSKPISFRVQILAVTKTLPENAPDFKGEKNLNYIKVGNFYKYSVGEFSTKEEAEKELIRVKKKFPQAFIIKVENEN